MKLPALWASAQPWAMGPCGALLLTLPLSRELTVLLLVERDTPIPPLILRFIVGVWCGWKEL